jgi:hypothetical protein
MHGTLKPLTGLFFVSHLFKKYISRDCIEVKWKPVAQDSSARLETCRLDEEVMQI